MSALAVLVCLVAGAMCGAALTVIIAAVVLAKIAKGFQ